MIWKLFLRWWVATTFFNGCIISSQHALLFTLGLKEKTEVNGQQATKYLKADFDTRRWNIWGKILLTVWWCYGFPGECLSWNFTEKSPTKYCTMSECVKWFVKLRRKSATSVVILNRYMYLCGTFHKAKNQKVH